MMNAQAVDDGSSLISGQTEKPIQISAFSFKRLTRYLRSLVEANSNGWLTSSRKQICEVSVLMQSAKRVSQLHDTLPFGNAALATRMVTSGISLFVSGFNIDHYFSSL